VFAKVPNTTGFYRNLTNNSVYGVKDTSIVKVNGTTAVTISTSVHLSPSCYLQRKGGGKKMANPMIFK